MMGHGKGGKSEEENEHKSSDLLRGQHLEEWIQDGQQVLPAFGAIGAEVPAAQGPHDRSPEEQQKPAQQKPPAPPAPSKVQGEYR